MQKNTTASHMIGWPHLLLGGLVFYVPLLMHYRYVLNAFYHFGAVYHDAGLFAQLLWRNDWILTNPHPIGDFSYFAIHFTPLLSLLSQLSWLLPVERVEFFAGFMASLYAAFALAMYALLIDCFRPQRHWVSIGLAVLAVGYAFNGVIMQGIWMPHFEYLMPLGIFLFLWHQALGRARLALFFFVLTLLMREDAGFHLAAVLGLLACLRLYEERRFREIRSEAIFIGVAMAYSALAWWATHAIRAQYEIDDTIFSVIYTGTPAYAHLTSDLLLERLGKIAADSPYLLTGFLATIIGSVTTRNPWLMVGFCAYLPWFVFNWTARNDNTGVLYAYYAFPFVLAMGWPVLAVVRRDRHLLLPGRLNEALALQAALVIIGLVVWNSEQNRLDFGPIYWARWGSYLPQEGVENRDLTRQFITRLNSDTEALGKVMVDNAVMSLAAGPVQGRHLLPPGSQEPADSLAYFNPFSVAPAPAIREHAKHNNWTHHYCMPGTPVCVWTNRSAEQLGIFSTLLEARPVPSG